MNTGKKIQIAVLPGDGIGAEVMHAALPIFAEMDVPIALHFGDIGWAFWQSEGTPLPDRTWDLIHGADATLVGAITSKPEREAMNELALSHQNRSPQYISPIIQLRQQLNLYANVRPCFDIHEQPGRFNFCVIRENMEGLYSGFDYYPIPSSFYDTVKQSSRWASLPKNDISCSLRLQSKDGLIRIFEYAFRYADHKGMQRVTLADKPNVLRKSSAFARECFEAVALRYPHLDADILNVDALGLWVVRRPEEFGVIVAENMFGDILSDIGAAVMGGLGFAPSANIGDNGGYFEPVHGSGPRIQSDCANPSAMFLTIAMMMEYLGYSEQGLRIKEAVAAVVREKNLITYDVGGRATTTEMANAIIEHYGRV